MCGTISLIAKQTGYGYFHRIVLNAGSGDLDQQAVMGMYDES